MQFLKRNIRWVRSVLLLMFATTVISVVIGHVFFVYYLKPDIESFKERTFEQILTEKPLRIKI